MNAPIDFETDEAGALPVRPDGVVAWRHRTAAPDAAEAGRRLRAALDAVLDRAGG